MSTIGIIAPATSAISVNFEQRLIGQKNLERLGYTIIYSPNFESVLYHTAGSVEQRLSDFLWAVTNPKIDIIMPVFGGYNTNQLLPHLPYKELKKVTKVLVGFSDISALLLASYNSQSSMKLLHGPTFVTFCDPNIFPYTITGFTSSINNYTVEYKCPGYAADDKWHLKPQYGPRDVYLFKSWKVYRSGRAEAPLIGGNVDTICAMLGTPYFPDTSGHILFLEDTDGVNIGRFHRSLTQMSQAQVFKDICGLIIGKVPRNTPLANDLHLKYVLDDVFKNSSFPILYNVNCSHVDPKMSLCLGALTVLDTELEIIKICNNKEEVLCNK